MKMKWNDSRYHETDETQMKLSKWTTKSPFTTRIPFSNDNYWESPNCEVKYENETSKNNW